MNQKLTCFVIAPIGDAESQIRRDSDDLLAMIIKPALEVYDIDVVRGDHRNESGQIDTDIIKLVQESDLCIVDLSQENVNVYYEMGRRDETGKPMILLKPANSSNLPVDVATKRYIEYDLDNRRAIVNARDSIKEAVRHFMDEGMERTKGTSLFAISEKIDLMERNLERILKAVSNTGLSVPVGLSDGEIDSEDPVTAFNVAIMTENIPRAEMLMKRFSYRMDKNTFYDQIVEQVAALGSHMAGDMLIDYLPEFMDTEDRVDKKVEYFAYLVQYVGKTNREIELINKIEDIALTVKDDDGNVPAMIYNQMSRLYAGAFAMSRELFHINTAIDYLEKAISINPNVGSYYYNLADCYNSKSEISSAEDSEMYIMKAIDCINKCLEADGETYDSDHLSLACKLYYKTSSLRYQDTFELLKQVSPDKAYLLSRTLK